jgi:peptide deformylase
MIRPLSRMGNPILRQVAKEVDLSMVKTESFGQLLQDLQDSMQAYGGIGIAAPQIGVALSVCLIELGEVNRYGQAVSLPPTYFINPKIEVLSPELKGYWEGCLSVPGLRGWVERPQHILVSYLDTKGEPQKLEAKGFLATVVQHELDHLFGKLYIDRLKSTEFLSYQEEFEQFILPSSNP